jgi:hypothetical protein
MPALTVPDATLPPTYVPHGAPGGSTGAGA